MSEGFSPRLMFAVCFPEKADWLLSVLEQHDAHCITVNYADGIKKATLADLLGLGNTKRIVLTAIIDHQKVTPLFEVLDKELYFEPNTGLAFTVNVDAYAGAKSMLLIEAFLKNYLDTQDDEEEENEEE